MKTRVLILAVVLWVSACSSGGIGGGSATSTPDYGATDTASQIETAIAARSTEAAIEAAYTPTPSPAPVEVKDLILTAAEINELANRWSDAPADNSANVDPNYCKIDCFSWVWQGGANSTLNITLIKADSRDGATNMLGGIKAQTITVNNPELPLPELVSLPPDTFIYETGTEESPNVFLNARHVWFVIQINIRMPDLSQDENLLFISLYADRQIQKLIAAGN